jgi:hypothetical protein
MSSIEDRLRLAALAVAGTVADGSAPRLQLPRRRLARFPEQLRGRGAALAAPAAAVAVAAIVVAVSLTARAPATGPGPRAGARPSAIVPAPPVLPPPYAVSLDYVGQWKGWKINRTDAVVTASTSSAVIATVTPPKPYNSFVEVTGTNTPDGRVFVLAAEHLDPPSSGPGRFPSARLYELRVSPAGSSAKVALTPLPIPVFPSATFGAMALSPDGSQLAVTQDWSQGAGRVGGLRVYSMRTGSWRGWALAGMPWTYPVEYVASPSWEASGRLIALDTSVGKCLDCIRLLNTAEGGTLQDASKIIVRSPNLHTQVDWDATLISPDGSTVLRSAVVSIPVGQHESYDVSRLYVYAARSGRLERTMDFPAHGIDETVLWSSPSGAAFILSRVAEGLGPGYITASLRADGRWYALALPAQAQQVAW